MAKEQIDLDNTEVAFKRLNNTALRNAYWLFNMMKFNWVGKIGSKFILAGMKMGLPVHPLIKYTMFKQFCGGETLEGCKPLLNDMKKYNVGAILDYSVEGAETESDLEKAANEIIRTVEFAKTIDDPKFAVFKMTGVARFALLEKIQNGEVLSSEEKAEFERVKSRVDRICQIAYTQNVQLMIDAEDYQIQNTIDDVVFEMMQKYNKKEALIFCTLQMYRWDRLDYLKAIHQQAEKEGFHIGVKIVRGAYLEAERERALRMSYPSPVHSTKEQTDKAFDDCMMYCVDHIDRIKLFCGTHNQESVRLLIELMAKKGIAANDQRVVFSQLHGMSDNLSYNLGSANYNVRKYVPFGPIEKVFPYLVRRAEENSSIQGQANRELSLLASEMKRRGKMKD